MKTLFTLFLVLVTVQFTMADRLEEVFKKTIEVKGQDYFEVSNRNGRIEVSGWDQATISIEAEKEVRADDHEKAKRLLEELEIVIKETDKKIIVYVDYPDRRSGSDGFLSWLFNDGSWNVSVNFKIFVPRKMDMDISSTNGKLEIKGCQGEIDLETTNGDINAEDMSGAINCYTTNGSVKVMLDKVAEGQQMTYKTTNGSIRLYLPPDINADLEAKTTNGSIDCDLPIKVYDYKSRKKIYGEINEGGPTIVMRTTNGSIKIREN